MPPVLSAGGGGRGGGGGEGWDGVSTGGTTATRGSAAGVSEETNYRKKEKQGNRTDLEVKHGKEVEMEYGEGRNIGRGEGENMRGVKGGGRR